MRTIDFNLDARLQADTHHVASLPLCEVLLMNDARYGWLILVPRRNGLIEIIDLPDSAQRELWQEINQVAVALRDVAPCDKLNIGALGNIVRQLHVHVIARREGDAAWPGPVWGHSPAQPYTDDELKSRIALLQHHLAKNIS
ncbi:HIT domain-containing protein [Dyella caseinilytica]|uniref:HIT domain-containing protein n=1 Tax=Dyella caseinilytica TaxID=1849581 RepID=A0ABX7GSE7_9GAMM|nr:HIT family protein [Dyella caseinilytica]QRN52190.1 HIT domain-containing protein [Dyella caseinilytica]GGA14007.1 histidine triad (HIT) protein [Dyella caseinilytica]